MTFRIEAKHVITTWPGVGRLRLVHQCRIRPPEILESESHTWEVNVNLTNGHWSGPAVGKNSDGRRFIYLAWLTDENRIFGRIKLYQSQVVGEVLVINATTAKGSPAFSTALVID